ncbi:RNA polymerase sigma factor CarQ [Stieleria neptunia]|uniref:RNA polymerase sigma factor CarQ n=1 Tax=Stieleria neptunia TaxID=2527979 RepID=A0A518HVS1_9BACT|nr:sigma-70 family RNA polymerase sigma factor [Stieleria neptunia]QDV44907.1 RNA polymerase sigma factor CarQ [Stieleria neptunia]
MTSISIDRTDTSEIDVPQLLSAARQDAACPDAACQDASGSGDAEALGQLLQLYRNYLTILATTQLDRRLRRRMSPSDLVQDTMLAAHRDFRAFRGVSEPEFLCWLRQILVNCLRDAVDMHLNAQKRDMRREVSIEQVGASLNKSACHLANVLADRGPSPSEPARRRERAVELADQLAKLRPEYRDVIVLRNLQGLSFNEIADRLDRRPGTVRMLWLRAMDKFKQTYEHPRA